MNIAREFMVYASLHWKHRGFDDLSLWSFAVRHDVWLHNRVKNQQSDLTTIELSTKTKYEHRYLLRYHVWGCPVYVLDPKLQNHQKIPRRNHRSRLGGFLGFQMSILHSLQTWESCRLVILYLNITLSLMIFSECVQFREVWCCFGFYLQPFIWR